jgi:hypothetical protein
MWAAHFNLLFAGFYVRKPSSARKFLYQRKFSSGMTGHIYLFYHMALQPNAGYGLLIHEVFEITHTTRHIR